MADPRFTPEPLTDAAGAPWHPPIGGGEVGGDRHYSGPEASAVGPWNCPACGVHNEGRVELGCASCGSGKPGYHKGVDQVRSRPKETSWIGQIEPLDVVEQFWQQWYTWRKSVDENPAGVQKIDRILAEAFRAGWIAGAQQRAHRVAPPDPPPGPSRGMPEILLPPEGKERRTLIAALKHFRDQILAEDPQEVAEGEWCSAAETEQLIAGLEDPGL